MVASGYPECHLIDPCDMSDHFVAPDDRSNACGGTGKNQIARLKREETREIGNHFRHLPDHLVKVSILAELAIDLEPNGAFVRMADGRDWVKRTAGGRFFKGLAGFPRATEFLRL